MTTRRDFIRMAALGLAGPGDRLRRLAAAPLRTERTADAFLDDVQRRTFRFFWETTNPANGLARDRFPTPSFASMAAVGFALTAYPIGVQRGFVAARRGGRADARDPALPRQRAAGRRAARA